MTEKDDMMAFFKGVTSAAVIDMLLGRGGAYTDEQREAARLEHFSWGAEAEARFNAVLGCATSEECCLLARARADYGEVLNRRYQRDCDAERAALNLPRFTDNMLAAIVLGELPVESEDDLQDINRWLFDGEDAASHYEKLSLCNITNQNRDQLRELWERHGGKSWLTVTPPLPLVFVLVGHRGQLLEIVSDEQAALSAVHHQYAAHVRRMRVAPECRYRPLNPLLPPDIENLRSYEIIISADERGGTKFISSCTQHPLRYLPSGEMQRGWHDGGRTYWAIAKNLDEAVGQVRKLHPGPIA